MAKRGPYKYTKKRISELAANLEVYVATTDMPILQQFAFQQGLSNVQCFYEVPELVALRERLMLKKATQLELGGLSERVNVGMAIFLLKNLGYSDQPKPAAPTDATEDAPLIEKLLGKEVAE